MVEELALLETLSVGLSIYISEPFRFEGYNFCTTFLISLLDTLFAFQIQLNYSVKNPKHVKSKFDN